MDSLKQLLAQFNDLADKNAWHSKHSPKNLAMAINVEAAELLEIFQWLSEAESRQLSAAQEQQVGHEMADVFLYLLSLADQLNIDLIAAAQEKMHINLRR